MYSWPVSAFSSGGCNLPEVDTTGARGDGLARRNPRSKRIAYTASGKPTNGHSQRHYPEYRMMFFIFAGSH